MIVGPGRAYSAVTTSKGDSRRGAQARPEAIPTLAVEAKRALRRQLQSETDRGIP